MCVIALAAKGVDIPDNKTIQQMWEHNSDGAGYAYVDKKKKKVIFKKGFLKLDDLLADLEPQREKLKNTVFAIHFRIGTSGRNDAHTCHPFPISTDFGQLRKLYGEEDAVLFHNGVVGKGKIINELSSDTQDFVAAVAPLLKKYSKSRARDAFLADATVGNRLLVLYKNGKMKMYGSWEKDGDLLVSNTFYKYDYGTYTSGNAGHNYWDDENWEKEYDYGKYHPQDTVRTFGGGFNSATQKIKPWPKELTIEQAAHVRTLWDALIKEDYVTLTNDDIAMLKRTADDFDDEHLYRDGCTFGYGDSYGCAWAENVVESASKPDEEKTLAEEAYEYIIQYEYADLTNEEIALLKKYADDYSSDTIKWHGYIFDYYDGYVSLLTGPKKVESAAEEKKDLILQGTA